MKKILDALDKIEKVEDAIETVCTIKDSVDKFEECSKQHDKLICATSAVVHGVTKHIVQDVSSGLKVGGALSVITGAAENVVTDSAIGIPQMVTGGIMIAGGEYLEMQTDKIGNRVFEYVLDYLESIGSDKSIDPSRKVIIKSNEDNRYYVVKIDNNDLMIAYNCNKNHQDSIVLFDHVNNNNQTIHNDNKIIKKDIKQIKNMLKYDDFRIGNIINIENDSLNMDDFFTRYGEDHFITPKPNPIEKKPINIQPPIKQEAPLLPSGTRIDIGYNKKKGFEYSVRIPVYNHSMGRGGGGFSCSIL